MRTINELLCLGFFVAGDEGNAEAQSLFICERKAFDNLCTGLTQPCQCPSNARKIIKTIQVCIANSDELAKFEFVFMHAPQKGHVLRVEFQCQQCKQKQWWASSLTLGGRYVINQK